MTYYPDVWMVLRLRDNTTNETIDKVLGGWAGGWAGTDNWRLSSGIILVKDTDYGWDFYNESGSLYVCYDSFQRFSGTTEAVFRSLQKSSHFSVEVVPFTM